MLTSIRPALILLACALSSAPTWATEKSFERQFDAPPGGQLTVDTDAGSVVLVGGDSRQIVVQAQLNGSDDFIGRMDISAVQADGRVSVTGRLGHASWLDWLFDFNRSQLLYTIHVPRDYPVAIRTAGGSLEVSHLSASLQASTSGGSITLRDVRGAIDAHSAGGHIDAAQLHGSAQLRTSGGHIEVKDATGDLRARTSGGGIYLQRLDAKVEAHTSGGPVRASMLSNRGIALSTAGGSIALLLPASAAGTIDAHTSGGGTHCTLALSATEIASSNTLRAAINGGGEPILLRTSGGSISIGRLD
jgi:hypothetical protein